MKYEYDVIAIGLGPAGMAVSIMGTEMGLRVCAIEKHKVGGECMNVGCIPSKALLRMAKYRHLYGKLGAMELEAGEQPRVLRPFARIQGHLQYISEQKTMRMFEKVQMVYQEGPAVFVDPHTVEVAGKRYAGRRIFLCVGTRPEVPPLAGIGELDYLTNETMFSLERVPGSLLVLGGGAIACEMAQAFSRLGSAVTMVIRGPRLMWREDQDTTNLLEKTFEGEGIRILRQQKPKRFWREGGLSVMETDKGERVSAEKVLVAAGRQMDYAALQLEKAGVAVETSGAIAVNRYLQTSQRHIYAVGDCNGHAQLSHAAMHQGMLAIMNSMMPWPLKRRFQDYTVPWTVFTEPQISQVGMRQTELDETGTAYEVVRVNYGDYGAAIAEGVEAGFVKVFVSKAGRIYGVYIAGEGSGEMINEWALAVQNRLRMHTIMMQQHSFPTMGFLSKRAAETWMMNRMKSGAVKKLCRWMFRLF